MVLNALQPSLRGTADGGAQSGNAVLLLFIAIALFGAISYALLQGTRGNLSMIRHESAKAAGTGWQDCNNAVQLATKRLSARGCGGHVSLDPDGANIAADSPQDGSCSVFHPNGGGVKPCGDYDPACMKDLRIGESCNGVIYAGISGGNRIYAAPADSGSMQWSETMDWNGAIVSANSASDGLSNTDVVLSANVSGPPAPFYAMEACRAMGPKWYLPAPDELDVLYDSRNTGDFAGSYTTAGWHASMYWASQRHTSTNAYNKQFESGTNSYGNRNNTNRVRCVRRD